MPEHLRPYLPIFVFFLLAFGFGAVNLLLSWILGPKKPNPKKLSPYECGITPVGDARHRYPIRFYIIAMLFILFDIEAIFMYPWAVYYKQLGLYGLVEMFIFLGILILGYVYLWKRGAFEWE